MLSIASSLRVLLCEMVLLKDAKSFCPLHTSLFPCFPSHPSCSFSHLLVSSASCPTMPRAELSSEGRVRVRNRFSLQSFSCWQTRQRTGVDASGQPGSCSAQDICIVLASGGRLSSAAAAWLCRSASVVVPSRFWGSSHSPEARMRVMFWGGILDKMDLEYETDICRKYAFARHLQNVQPESDAIKRAFMHAQICKSESMLTDRMFHQ